MNFLLSLGDSDHCDGSQPKRYSAGISKEVLYASRDEIPNILQKYNINPNKVKVNGNKFAGSVIFYYNNKRLAEVYIPSRDIYKMSEGFYRYICYIFFHGIVCSTGAYFTRNILGYSNTFLLFALTMFFAVGGIPPAEWLTIETYNFLNRPRVKINEKVAEEFLKDIK